MVDTGQKLVDYFLGLDLGQAQDPSALVGLERCYRPDRCAILDPRALVPHYTVRGLRRWPLGTLYTTVVDEVVETVRRPPLAGCRLGVDYTGCGRPVVDMLKKANPVAHLRPVYITGGAAITPKGLAFHVSKIILVSTAQTVLQSRRLEIPDTIPEQKTLEKELLAFRVKVSNKGTEQFEADWRQGGAHDDIVLGLSIALFLGERFGRLEHPGRPLLYYTPNYLQGARGRYVAGDEKY